MAARELQRAERLNQSGAIADRDLEQARINNNSAQSQVADAKARLTLAERQLADAEVRAPFSGIVNERQVSTGDIVQLGGELMTVVDPSSMEYDAAVPASDLNQIRVGAPVVFTVNGYPGKTFTGRVARVSPTADQSTGQVRLAVSVPNASNNLVGGLFADGRVTAVSHMAMTAPFNAVDNRGIRPWVLVVKGGKAERREVDLGVRDEATERWEIKSGVTAGDTLLTGSAQGLTPGTPVRVAPPISDQPAARTDATPKAAEKAPAEKK
jgi:RND family efflux transporter MFP subunit